MTTFVQVALKQKTYSSLLHRQRVWLCFRESLKPHAAILHTNYKHEPQQRLRGSTLTFGFGFFKAPFLLASSGFLFSSPCWRMNVKLASDQDELWVKEEDFLLCGSYDSRCKIQICLFAFADHIRPGPHWKLLRLHSSNLDWAESKIPKSGFNQISCFLDFSLWKWKKTAFIRSFES